MDNITHSLVGAVLGQTGLKTKTRKGMAALVLGANAPDIDVALGWVPWLPLATHRGFTHGVIGALIVLPLLLAMLLWWIDSWQARRGQTYAGSPPMHFGWLLGLSFLGTLTHPLLDLQTTYAVQLLSPFSTKWFHTDTLFIIDVWLWVLLGASFWVSRRNERKGRVWRSHAIGAFTIMLAYIAINGVITASAKNQVHSVAREGVDRISASPPPIASWRRDLVWLRNGAYRRAHFDPFAAPPFALKPGIQPSNMGDALVPEAIAASPALARFLRWSIMPAARVDRSRCEVRVTVNDARYSRGVSRNSFENIVVLPTGAKDCQ